MLRAGRAGASAGGRAAHDMDAQAAVAAAARCAHAGACLRARAKRRGARAPTHPAVHAAQEEASAALPGNAVLSKPLNEVPASGEELADWGGQWRKPTSK